MALSASELAVVTAGAGAIFTAVVGGVVHMARLSWRETNRADVREAVAELRGPALPTVTTHGADSTEPSLASLAVAMAGNSAAINAVLEHQMAADKATAEHRAMMAKRLDSLEQGQASLFVAQEQMAEVQASLAKAIEDLPCPGNGCDDPSETPVPVLRPHGRRVQ